MVGWFALFCEACGAKQEPRDGGKPAPDGAAASASAPAPPSAPTAIAAPSPLEQEVRTHLVAPAADARAVARELFQAQLRLIHRHREGVEALLKDATTMSRAVAAARRTPGRHGRTEIDRISQSLFDAEERWGSLQSVYNKESEALEEESREHMEAADFDAYLAPDETAKVENEFAVLRDQFEAVDSTLRDVGRAVALARQEGGSRYFGGVGGGGGRLILVLVSVAAVAWSLFSALFLYREDPIRVAAMVGPVVLALVMWVIWEFSRRS
jgi:hypothetical protein